MNAPTELLDADVGYTPELIEADAAPAADEELAAARHMAIALAAYRLAEARGFEPGKELDDWLQAERAVYRDRPAVGA